MNFRDDTKPPLSTELSDLYWGTHLTEYERLLEDLDDRPSRLLLLLAERTGRRASWTGAPGADRLSRPTPMAPGSTSLPAPGPTLAEETP